VNKKCKLPLINYKPHEMMKQKFISYGTCRRFSLPKNYFSELGFYYRLGFASRYCDEDEYVCAEKCDS